MKFTYPSQHPCLCPRIFSCLNFMHSTLKNCVAYVLLLQPQVQSNVTSVLRVMQRVARRTNERQFVLPIGIRWARLTVVLRRQNIGTRKDKLRMFLFEVALTVLVRERTYNIILSRYHGFVGVNAICYPWRFFEVIR